MTFKEPINSNRNNITLKYKEISNIPEINAQKENIKENQQDIQENKNNAYNLLTGKTLKKNEEIKNAGNSIKNIPKDNSKTPKKNNNINKIKVVKGKIIKKSLKTTPFKDNEAIKQKNINEYINKNNYNKTNSSGIKKSVNINNKNKEQEFDIIKQITKEKNNNIYNDILNDEVDFIIDIKDLKKRPSAGPAFNPVLTLNKKNINKNNNINDSNKNKVIYNNIRRKKENNNNSRLEKTPNNIYSSNNENYFYENNNDLFNSNKNNSHIVNSNKKANKTIKLNNKKMYQGIGFQTYQKINYVDKNDIINEEIIPEDNYKNVENIKPKIKSINNNSNKKIKINKDINNVQIKNINNINNIYPMNNKSLNNTEANSNKMKYINNIKTKNKVSQNRNGIKKNVKIIKLTDENMNNAFFNKTEINPIINNKMIKSIQNPNTNIKKINIKQLSNLQIINNNNFQNHNINYRNINSKTPNNTLAYNNIVQNPQINYQFPVYINNNNNIYNTQYLNTAGNIPINPNINQINQKIIALNQTPNNTNLNFGQNPGVQFINAAPNNYNIYGNMKYYHPTNFNIYQYPKKYNVSLIRK